MVKPLVAMLAASAVLSAASCGRREVKSDIILTSPSSSTAAAVGETFGAEVEATVRADNNSVPRDPAEADVAPVDLTAEPIAIPAD